MKYFFAYRPEDAAALETLGAKIVSVCRIPDRALAFASDPAEEFPYGIAYSQPGLFLYGLLYEAEEETAREFIHLFHEDDVRIDSLQAEEVTADHRYPCCLFTSEECEISPPKRHEVDLYTSFYRQYQLNESLIYEAVVLSSLSKGEIIREKK